MDLPKLTDLDISGKRVLLRLDLDTDPDPNDLRIRASEKTLNYLKEKGTQIIILGHKGRPNGICDNGLSLKPLQPIFDRWGARVEENLRFDLGEEANNVDFVKKLATLGDFFVNEAFASSHREHASIVGLPKLLPHAAGFRFIEEVENLGKILDNPKRPTALIISGVKKDKIQMIEEARGVFDKVLVAGRLSVYLQDIRYQIQDPKVIVGNLIADTEDITLNTITRFENEIARAGTIVLAGVPGKYEDEGHRLGTERIFKAVANSKAFKVAGGGDTEVAISMLELSDKFDWISVGGGAMLEFLTKGTLPGIEALIS